MNTLIEQPIIAPTKGAALGPAYLRSNAADRRTEAARVGRRRPGRVAKANPHLIPLLRDPASADYVAPADRLGDDHGPAKGIAMGLLLVAPFWALVIWSVW
jgi:hypothetical protein